MSQNPSLDQYPGYFPPAKPPFWNRTKAAAAAGIGGLVIGLIVAAGGSASPSEPATAGKSSVADVPVVDVDGAVESAVADENERMQEKLDQQRASATQRLSTVRSRAATARRHAVRAAIAHTRAVERAKAARAVAAAKAQAQSQSPEPAGSGGGTDPRFSYCYEANDAGYGPYYRGQDPEYAWYDDADNDGEVCE